MALWAVLLLEYWKRKNATLAYRWDCSDYEDIEVSGLGWVASGKGHTRLSMVPFQERPRPQFAAKAPLTALNPITGEDEPYFPEKSRVHRMLAGSVVLLMMVRGGSCHPVPSAPVFLSHRGPFLQKDSCALCLREGPEPRAKLGFHKGCVCAYYHEGFWKSFTMYGPGHPLNKRTDSKNEHEAH